MNSKHFQIAGAVLCLSLCGCQFITNPGRSNGIRLIMGKCGRIQKSLVLKDSSNALRRVRCVIKQGSFIIIDKDMEIKGDVFTSEVQEVKEGSDYSVWMYGYGVSAYCSVSSFQGNISVSQSSVTEVYLSWDPFQPQLCLPVKDSVVDTSEITFAWSSVPCACSYYLEVDNNERFTSPSLSISVDDTCYRWNTEICKGTFFWRVTCRHDRGFGDKSITNNFSINETG